MTTNQTSICINLCQEDWSQAGNQLKTILKQKFCSHFAFCITVYAYKQQHKTTCHFSWFLRALQEWWLWRIRIDATNTLKQSQSRVEREKSLFFFYFIVTTEEYLMWCGGENKSNSNVVMSNFEALLLHSWLNCFIFLLILDNVEWHSPSFGLPFSWVEILK